MQHIRVSVFKVVFSAIILSFAVCAFGQASDARTSFSPYSMYGIGTISMPGTAMNKAMGGIGIGLRDNRHINYLNPASVSARDTLSFMLDVGVVQKNYLFNGKKVGYKNGILDPSGSTIEDARSARNTFTVNHLMITFPLYKKSAMILGLVPYSSVSYSFEREETDPYLITKFGDAKYHIFGEGGLYKAFAGISADIFSGLSIAVEGDLYFGSFDKYSNLIYSGTSGNKSAITGDKYVVRSFSGKAGLQYSYKFGKESVLTAGATYSLKTPLKGRFTNYARTVQGSVVDTVYHDEVRTTSMNIPAELAFGASYRRNDRLLVGLDFIMQDWKSAGFEKTMGVNMNPGLSSTFRGGFEYTPDRYDVRYYMNRITYRAGAYYQTTNLVINGSSVNAFGLTFGVEMPIHRWYNSVGLSVDFGQRGSLKNNLVRERYFMINASISIHEIWFKKLLYN